MPVSLLCLVGLPGSGKTTLAAAIKRHFSARFTVVVVEYDSYFQKDDYLMIKDGWKESRRGILGKIEHTAQNLMAEGGKAVVVLDDNFYYRSMRYEVRKMAKKLRVGFGQIYVNAPFDVCVSRNAARLSPLPSEILMRMQTTIEPPEPAKNFWERDSVVLSGEPPEFELIFELISKTWDEPVCEPSGGNRSFQENSIVHYADLALRHIVSGIIMGTPVNERSGATESLSTKKKQILEDIKLKNISLPELSPGDDLVLQYAEYLRPHFSTDFS